MRCALVTGVQTCALPISYTLLFPVYPTADRHRRTHAALREKIVTWIREAGAALHAEAPSREERDRRPHGYAGERSTTIDGLPLRTDRRVLWSENGRHHATLFVSRLVGADWVDQRLESVETRGKRRSRDIG